MIEVFLVEVILVEDVDIKCIVFEMVNLFVVFILILVEVEVEVEFKEWIIEIVEFLVFVLLLKIFF